MEKIQNSADEVHSRLSIVPESIRLPIEAYLYFPTGDDLVVKSKSATQRIIFQGGTKFTITENEAIIDFKKYCSK